MFTVEVTRFLPSPESRDVMEHVDTSEAATMAEVIDVIEAALPENIGSPRVCIALAKQIVALSDTTGGDVGPLPDGMTIRVKAS